MLIASHIRQLALVSTSLSCGYLKFVVRATTVVYRCLDSKGI